MIAATLIDGVQVNSDKIFLSSIKDSSAAQIDLQSYSRGGRSGISLGNPFYRGFVIAMEWTVIGDSYSDLVTQRDRLARFFKLRPDKSQDQTKTLAFVMADGSTREIPVIFSNYNGTIVSADSQKCVIQVIAQSEIEYFVSSETFTDTLRPYSAGGFAIPFDVPLDMANSPIGEPLVIQNAGNSEYYPIITIHGQLIDAEIINDTTGVQIEYTQELEVGDSLVIDTYHRTAVLNGITNELANITGLNHGQGWYLESGSNVIRLVVTSGTGYADITWKHAYRGL